MRHLVILLSITLLSWNAQGADISGSYSAFPASASEEALMIEDLGGLIAGAEKQTVNARGQLSVVHISQSDDRIAVRMFDEAGLEVLNTTLLKFAQLYQGREMVCVTRSWMAHGVEGGSNGYGTLLLRMYREHDQLIILAESTQIVHKFLWRKEKRYIINHSYVFRQK